MDNSTYQPEKRKLHKAVIVEEMEETTYHNESILPRVAEGDMEAVDDCIRCYGNLIWSLARRFSPNIVDAEDATQEIFVELWQKAGRFEPGKSAEATFVTMIARRRLIDRFRKQARSLETVCMGSDDFDPAVDDTQHSAELIDEAAKATQCLEALKSNTQEVLKLSIHEGKSHSQIAATLDLPLGTVKSYARRGLLQLRDCMQRFVVGTELRGVS